jgi:hypothetical protein
MPPRNSNAETERLLGQIDERTKAFGRAFDELKRDVRKLTQEHDRRLSSLEDDRTAATGGRRVWGLIGNSVAGVFGAALMALVNRWGG